MKTPILLSFCLAFSIVLAAEPPSTPPDETAAPSDTSIKELLELAKVRKILDTMSAQVDTLLKQTMQKATQGQTVSAKVQRHIERLESDIMTAFKEEFSWDKMEPLYLRIYRKSLTQQEVDGMLAFYKTPAGQAVIDKMPVIMQNTFAEVQQMMGPMMKRMERAQQEVIAEMQAEKPEKKKGHG